jgi:omega-amidase
MKIGLIQMEVLAGEVEKNRMKALSMMEEAVRRGCQLLVLPEIWTTGYALKNINELAETIDGETLTMLRAFAKEKSIEIITGSIPIKENGKVYNNAFALNKTGDVIVSYRKLHLFTLMGEERFFHPGEHTALFDLSSGKAGLIICYDIRFPELARTLALGGAKALFVPAEWPSLRGDHWRTLNIARAIENQMFVIAVNCVGQHKQNVFYGHSMVIDPWGEVRIEGNEQEAVLVTEIDFTMVEEVRAKMPIFTDRRPDMYTC